MSKSFFYRSRFRVRSGSCCSSVKEVHSSSSCERSLSSWLKNAESALRALPFEPLLELPSRSPSAITLNFAWLFDIPAWNCLIALKLENLITSSLRTQTRKELKSCGLGNCSLTLLNEFVTPLVVHSSIFPLLWQVNHQCRTI